MMRFARRTVLAGVAAATLLVAAPAIGDAAAAANAMPPVDMVETNGIQLAVYQAGSGPAVVLLHGFPGLAYTWRHQIPALVDAGYRVIVPDLRGYGLSDIPERVEDYDIGNLTDDVVGMLDSLNVEEAVFVGHDWGGLLAWQMSLFYEERTKGVISFNTPHIPHWGLWLHHELLASVLPEEADFVFDPQRDPIAQMREVYSPGMYVLLFQDDTLADEIMNNDPRGTLRAAFRKDLGTPDGWSQMPAELKNMEYYGHPAPTEFPGQDVLSPVELDFYVSQYKRTGFTPAINWYRNITQNWEAGRDVDQTVRVPSLMISAENDVVLRPSMTDGMAAFVPDLERRVIADAWHWTPEEKPEEANKIVLEWLEARFPD